MENETNFSSFDRPQNPPDNYLVWAILSTLLCCLPLGIVSIVKSTEVNKKWNQGDYAGAQQSSLDAKKFATWSAIAGIIVWVLYAVLATFGILGSTMTNF
jgi:hypothetical protein